MGNGLSYVVLFGALPVGVALFLVLRPPVAAVTVFLGSFMFLPERVEVDLPLVPSIGKQEVAALASLLGTAVRAPGLLVGARPLRGPDLLVVLLLVGDIGTALTNRDVLVRGPTVLPALSLHEGISMVLADILQLYVPFLLGRALFVSVRDLRVALVALAVGGALYTPFLFVELMMSPQLHAWIYGFHQHDFVQTLRGGGFRPTVFMPHGLAVGLFMAWASVASLVLLKGRHLVGGVHPGFVALWNAGFLVACKSLGAAVYALVSAPLVVLLRPVAVVRIAALLGVVVLAYPTLRASGLFPVRALVEAAQGVSARAAQSLQFRFHMETLLADRAAERPIFGWGRFRRSMIFDEHTGRDISVSDGHWIVTYGIRGAWGFLCTFGVLVLPIFLVHARLGRVARGPQRIMLAGLALILAVGAVDLLPNALHNGFTLFLSGALWGLTRALSRGPHAPQVRRSRTAGAPHASRPPRLQSAEGP